MMGYDLSLWASVQSINKPSDGAIMPRKRSIQSNFDSSTLEVMENQLKQLGFGFLLLDVSRLRKSLYDRNLQPLGMTRPQWIALVILSRAEKNGMSQTELAHGMLMKKAAVGMLLDRLESDGYVKRTASATDRRINNVQLTEAGKAVLMEIGNMGELVNSISFQGISDKELQITTSALKKMKLNIKNALDEILSDDSDSKSK